MSDFRDTSSAFDELRSAMLSQDPKEIGVTTETFPYPVFGILMETGIAEGTFTLACLADGTTSLYLSDGFGTVGGVVNVGLRCPV